MRIMLIALAFLAQAPPVPQSYDESDEAIPGQECLVKWRVGKDMDVGPLVQAGAAQRYYDWLSSRGVRAYLECYDSWIA